MAQNQKLLKSFSPAQDDGVFSCNKNGKNGRSLREREAGSSPSATLRVRMTTRKTKAKATAKAELQVSPLRVRKSANAPVEMTTLYLRRNIPTRKHINAETALDSQRKLDAKLRGCSGGKAASLRAAVGEDAAAVLLYQLAGYP